MTVVFNFSFQNLRTTLPVLRTVGVAPIGNTYLKMTQGLPCLKITDQILFNFVTMRTLIVWSNAEHTHSPSLSGLQSKAL